MLVRMVLRIMVIVMMWVVVKGDMREVVNVMIRLEVMVMMRVVIKMVRR